MAIKSEIKQWCSTRWPFLTTVSRSNRNLECRIQWRKENHRTWRKPSVTNGLRILSNFGLIFQALHFQYIRFLFIHGQLCPYLRFIVSSKIFLIVSLLKLIFLFLPQVEEIFATITLNTTRHCVSHLFLLC